MATQPGILTDWPWKKLGSFKYLILAPWGIQSIYAVATKGEYGIDYFNLLIIPFLLWRILHNQIWISFSRHRTAKGNNQIVDKSIEFKQVDREANWDDHIILSGVFFYIVNKTMERCSFLPFWRTDGIIILILLHMGPVEYLYYWLHRAMHHHYLYSRYHSHHHSSVAPEPTTSVTHPFIETASYYLIIIIPLFGTIFTGTASLASQFGYTAWLDFVNNMGHCNFEIIPKWLFSIFPPLKYMMYTPSFHSLHHTHFRTNYSLFMPFYDYIHGTMDVSSDELHEASLKRQEHVPNVVYLTHLTTPESLYHFQTGFASFSSRPYKSKWYMRLLMWPLTFFPVMLSLIYGRTFIVETNFFKKLNLQSWAIPRYTIQYSIKWQRKAISDLIAEAILQAETKGVKVLSLGLLNQSEELNRNGALYIQKNPKLNIRLVDGSSLAVAIVLNTIPKGTTEILFRGNLSKVAYALISALCHRGIKVTTFYENEKIKLSAEFEGKINCSKSYEQKIWIIGDGMRDEEQVKAPKGTIFIPYSKFPPNKIRNDAFYHHTPAMVAPNSFRNLHSCENWLPRRVMSAWRVAGILHALEGWNVHECGDTVFDVDKIWAAAIKHGFTPSINFP